jgi:hypothetical protein
MNRPWKFIIEYYFQQPSTKYDWNDFKKKVFVRNPGKELERKMVIKNIHSTTELEYIELKHVCLHMNACIQSNNVMDPNFRKLLDSFMLLKDYLYDYFIYQKIKAQAEEGKFSFYLIKFFKINFKLIMEHLKTVLRIPIY